MIDIDIEVPSVHTYSTQQYSLHSVHSSSLWPRTSLQPLSGAAAASARTVPQYCVVVAKAVGPQPLAQCRQWYCNTYIQLDKALVVMMLTLYSAPLLKHDDDAQESLCIRHLEARSSFLFSSFTINKKEQEQ